jgi:uncharacterized protein (DUF1697 family)
MIPMPELRALAAGLGWDDVRSYVQSGNLVFAASGRAAALEQALETAVRARFSLDIPVIVRSAAQWSRYIASVPFAAADGLEPKSIILALSQRRPARTAAALLRERATLGERVEQVGDAIWIHYAGGFASSKLTPGMFDRVIGSPVTTRNWRTVLTLGTLVGNG